jgi:hypothetical protein
MSSESELTAQARDSAASRGLARLEGLPLVFPVLFVVLCFLYAVKGGFLTASPVRSLDSQWLYVSGRCFRAHLSPYHVDTFNDMWRLALSRDPLGCPFSYLPAVALLTLPLSFLPWPVARIALDGVNVATLIAIVALVARLFRCLGLVRWSRFPGWLGLGLGLLVSGVPAVLLLGQTTLFGVLGVLVALVAVYERRSVWLFFGLLLCAFKPQVAVIPLAFVFVAATADERRRFVVPALLAGVVCFAPLLLIPHGGLIDDVRASLRGYQAFAANRPPKVNGLATLITSGPPAGLWAVAGVIASVLLGWRQRLRRSGQGTSPASVPSANDVIMTLALTGVAMQLHPYDAALYVPLVALAVNATSWGSTLRLLPGLVMVGRSPNVAMLLRGLGASGEWVEPRVATLGALYLFIVAVTWRGDRGVTVKAS